MSSPQSLQERAKNAILQKALYRWENAAVISSSLLLTAFDGLFDFIPFIPWWGWPVLGVVGAGALFYSTLTDPDVASKAVAEMLREEYRPERLRDKKLRAKMQEALGYHARIYSAIEARGEGSMIGDELHDAADQMNEWIREIYALAKRIDQYQIESRTFGLNRQRAENSLKQLQRRLQMEGNESVRATIQDSIQSLEYQIQTLNAISDTMQRAQLMLDNKITAMGTIYLQSTLAGIKDIDSSRAKRLRHEIAEEVQEMDDILLALDEVYASSG